MEPSGGWEMRSLTGIISLPSCDINYSISLVEPDYLQLIRITGEQYGLCRNQSIFKASAGCGCIIMKINAHNKGLWIWDTAWQSCETEAPRQQTSSNKLKIYISKTQCFCYRGYSAEDRLQNFSPPMEQCLPRVFAFTCSWWLNCLND